MPEYQFVSYVDNNGSNATKAARSHAIRTALHRRNASNPSPDDEAAVTRTKNTSRPPQPALRGRFRVLTSPAQHAAASRNSDSSASQEDRAPRALISKAKNPKPAGSRAKTASQPYGAAAKSPILRLKDNCLDPFESLPIPSNPAADTLIQYFLKGFNLNLSALDTQGPWLPYAMQNPLLLRATVALAAGFWSASLPTLDVRLRREGYLQKGETMRLIRKRLDADIGAGGHLTGGDDAFVLAAVATLANVEAFNGEFRAADVHLRGLYDMVQARGGVAAIQHEYILCRCISWVDIQVATGIGRMPMFPLFHTIDQVILPTKVLAQAIPAGFVHLETADADVEAQRDSEQDTAAARAIFMLLRQAIAAQASNVPVAVASIRVVMSTADVRILRFLFGYRDARPLDQMGTPESISLSRGGDPLAPIHQRFGGSSHTTALVLAAHVFLYVVLRHVPTTSQLLRTLCCRLRHFLQGETRAQPVAAARVVNAWAGHMALLVWVAFVGVVGSGWTRMNADNADWFRSLFHAAVSRAQDEGVIASADDEDALEALLETFLWSDAECGTALESLVRCGPDPVDTTPSTAL